MDAITKSKFSTLFTDKKKSLTIALVVVLAVALIGYLVLMVRAAGFFATVEPAKGTLSGNAQIVGDAGAANGQAIQFNEPPVTNPPTPPTTGSRCPAFPAFPDASCTGVIPGTALTKYTGPSTVAAAGTVIENKLITGGLCIAASNVTVRNSKIEGDVYTALADDWHGACAPAGSEPTNIVFEDVEIVGPGTPTTNDVEVATTFAMSGNNFTCKRCNVHRWGLGFAVKKNVTIEDSYIHDTIGFHGKDPRLGSDGIAHRSCIGGNGALNATYRHNRVVCNDLNNVWGVSGAIVVYSQKNHMRAENVLVEKNYVSADGGAFCMYAGTGDIQPINVRVLDNRFSRGTSNKCAFYGPLSHYGSGVTITGNTYTDGAPIEY